MGWKSQANRDAEDLTLPRGLKGEPHMCCGWLGPGRKENGFSSPNPGHPSALFGGTGGMPWP